jgi:hypothetical protein
MLNLFKKAYSNHNYVNWWISYYVPVVWLECLALSPSHLHIHATICCSDNKDYESAISPFTSEKLKNLGWKPRKVDETLSDSIEYFEKAGFVQDVEGCPCRLPHLFHFGSGEWKKYM